MNQTRIFDGVQEGKRYVIPKKWRRKWRVEIVKDDEIETVLRFPVPVEFYEPGSRRTKIRRVWELRCHKQTLNAQGEYEPLPPILETPLEAI